MAKISVKWLHALPSAELRAAAERVATNFAGEYGAVWAWQGPDIAFKCERSLAKGVEGVIKTSPRMVQIDVTLPMILMALSGKIQKGIEEGLAQHLGGHKLGP